MDQFEILANEYLCRNTRAFYHVPYVRWGNPGNLDYVNVLKNTFNRFAESKLMFAAEQLLGVLLTDFLQILQSSGLEMMTVCVVPRAKAEHSYHANQFLFKSTIRASIGQLQGFGDGTSYIRRHTNTRTTHLRNSIPNYINDGPAPFPGITTKTCDISVNVRGKNVLLVDDIYTPCVNVDEDAIQGLLNVDTHSYLLCSWKNSEKEMIVKISDNALNVLAAKTYRGIGKAWIIKRLRGNETVNNIVTLLNEDVKEDRLITQADFENVKEKIKNCIGKLAEFADGVVAIGDENFPSYRGNVKSSERPVILFYRGDLSLLNKTNKNVAVIGLLNPDKDTETVEREVVSKLVSCGATIVSGLALGCDTVAHRQALRSDGKTVAILPAR